MSNLADLLFQNSILYPNKTAISCDGKFITYKELAKLVCQYSNFLLENGVLKGDHIGVSLNNSIESVALIFTAANIGVGLVPINSTSPLKAIRLALVSTDVKHLIAQKSFFEQCEKSDSISLSGLKICKDGEFKGCLNLEKAKYMCENRPNIPICGDEILILSMTSGSTNTPKPIILTQDDKFKRCMEHIKLYSITKDDNILAATPLSHSLAERLVIIPLIIGGSSILLPRFTPNIWLNYVRDCNVTFTISVSAQLSQIAELLASPFVPEINSLRCIVSSSALLPPHVKNELISKLECDFHEMYGTSEISTATDINFREALNKKQSLGKPLSIADIKIFKTNGEIASIGEIGEICCKTELICSGYYALPKLFDEAINDGYFKTGDMGYLDEDGYLYFSGRKTEIIITGGINVYPQDIEKCLGELPEIKECAAFAYPDDKLVEVVALAIVVKPNCILKKRTIQIKCARELADFQQPHKFFFLSEIPKNSLGKLNRHEILQYVKLILD